MKKILGLVAHVSLLLAAAISSHADAQSYFVPGQLLTATQFNSAFAGTLPLAGGVLAGPLTAPTLTSSHVTITGGSVSGLNSLASLGIASFGNQTTWLKSLISCTTDCAQTWSQSYGGGMGLLGATRTSDNSLAGSMAAQGVAGYAINNNTAQVQTAYAAYFEARKYLGAGTTQGMEIDLVNQGSVVNLDPYNMISSGATLGLWLSSGRPDVTARVANVSTAVGIINNGTAFEKGITFQSTALDTSGGEGQAIVLPANYGTVWYGRTGTKVAGIRSDATTPSLRLVFVNGQLDIESASGTVLTTIDTSGNIRSRGNVSTTGSVSAGGAINGTSGAFTSITTTGKGAMPLYGTSGTAVNAPHMVQGRVALSSGSATVTLSGAAVYSSSSSYTCTANDTTGAHAVKVAQTSGTSITFTGIGSDTVQFMCAGS
ncbi:hypothetical protein [Burkholderia lata]|uniref:Outer membrane autotransporter n=1 Tax=Burkholderia lata (strain ATCC 17760 / DSM 23089 / LMG 22485 / NCIMB 9086 / R18194 / 383) TaxID=482957 RepID=A0A6P2WBW6_BURL3|nr:hypothetical protein [Burkholderia lata]VWC97798.1 outer membrane autotransporter [Burkholderia lata]